MMGLLKRHEVEILLKAGHNRTEVAGLTGISPSSVQRIAGEAGIEHFDDIAERRKRRIGRPSIVEGFRKTIRDILEQEPDLPSLDIFRQLQKAGLQWRQDRPLRPSGLTAPERASQAKRSL